MDFIPFDIKCYNKLHEKFQYLFEPKLINEICSKGELKSFKTDTNLMEVGMVITHMPLVISGSVKILTEDKNGNELLLYYLELGDTCAVTLNCCTKASKSTIIAITEEPTELLFVPVEMMEEWMVRYKSWRAFVLDSYNIRLNEMVEALDNIVFNSLEDRLIKYLRDKAWITKKSLLKISHLSIANDMHSSRVVISRLMKKLENQGVIKQYRNSVEFIEFSSE